MSNKKNPDEDISVALAREANLPGWKVVPHEPIVPGGAPPAPNAMNNYFSGSIDPGMLQSNAGLRDTQIGDNRIPKIPLMPLNLAGHPTGNSAITSGTAQPIAEAAAAGAGSGAAAVSKALPGTVTGTGANASITPATLANVGDSSNRFGQTASGLSYRPLTNPLSATTTAAGSPPTSSSVINVASFTMVTSSKGNIAISSGSIIGLNPATLYYVYYNDPNLLGGSVSFLASTTKTDALGTGTFFVGSITTPVANAAASTLGAGDGGTGAQTGGTSVFLFGAVLVDDTSAGTNAVTNPNNAFDGNLSTFASMTMTSVASGGVSGTINATLTLSGASPTSAPWSSLTLYVVSSITDVAHLGHCEGAVAYSLDGGNTYTNIYDVFNSNRALTTDSVTLSTGQNLSLVRVRFTESSLPFTNHADMSLNAYEAYVVGII